MLGYCTAVIARVRAAEQHAAAQAGNEQPAPGQSTALVLVLASRDQVVVARVRAAYPVTRKAKVTYSGSGYRDGYTRGQQADIGGTRLTPRARPAIR